MKEIVKRFGVDPRYAAYCDHSVLKAYTVREKIIEFCDEAKRYGVRSVNVCPANVRLVAEQLKGTGIKTGAAIGFPLGANKASVKAFEAREALKDGADILDMVINIGALRDGDDDLVLDEISQVVAVANGRVPVKVILECCYLTDEQKTRACKLAMQAGADVIKTSTGMGPGGATVHDVKLIRSVVGERMQIKASGNIRRREDAYALIMAGADMLGVSNVPQIIFDDETIISATTTNTVPCV